MQHPLPWLFAARTSHFSAACSSADILHLFMAAALPSADGPPASGKTTGDSSCAAAGCGAHLHGSDP